MGDGKRANDDVTYSDLPWDDPRCLEALEHCPWRTTDHWPPETRGQNYCTWCEGYVTALLNKQEITATLQVVTSALGWCAGHLETCQGGQPSPPPKHVQDALVAAEKALS